MAFALEMYPVVYLARYSAASESWDEQWITQDSVPYDELQKLDEKEREKILIARNTLPLPAVSYTSQYGYGCFEGMKAFPQKNGGIAIFRPDRNGARFENSLKGLKCPVFPKEMYVKACAEFIKRNADLGYVPPYEAQWEENAFASAKAVYMRPFMTSEGAIGVACAKEPYVLICATTVSAYFSGKGTKAVTTERIRATPNGTGYIKCASNYVISALAKKEAEEKGFMEAVFLDSEHRRYVQEGSSCNIFFLLKDGTLVTPDLQDTILPGITRASIIDLARGEGIKTEERLISIEEAAEKSAECFVTGTAAGITPIESITHKGVETVFNGGKIGKTSAHLQRLLKGIQYGAAEDARGWNYTVV
ncbi:branched-chain-amino-acid transaminase [Treponema sp. OMZ 840]|uniref:branched-chain-amino-acid transaminase n=1 Tax=Treponema sp. OMZ 840 TaxID=244313 RepID=UPI003D921C78